MRVRKSNDDKVGQFLKTKDQRIESDNENAPNIICKMKRWCSNAKLTTIKIWGKKSGIMQKFIKVSIVEKSIWSVGKDTRAVRWTKKSHSQNFSRVNKFLKLSKEGLTFLCVICNRCPYLKTMLEFKLNKYDLDLAEMVHKVFNNSRSYMPY